MQAQYQCVYTTVGLMQEGSVTCDHLAVPVNVEGACTFLIKHGCSHLKFLSCDAVNGFRSYDDYTWGWRQLLCPALGLVCTVHH